MSAAPTTMRNKTPANPTHPSTNKRDRVGLFSEAGATVADGASDGSTVVGEGAVGVAAATSAVAATADVAAATCVTGTAVHKASVGTGVRSTAAAVEAG